MWKILAAVFWGLAALGALALPGREAILTWAPWPTLLLWPLGIVCLFADWRRLIGDSASGRTATSLTLGLVLVGTLGLGWAYGSAPTMTLTYAKDVLVGGQESSVQIWQPWTGAAAATGPQTYLVYTRDNVLPLWWKKASYQGQIRSAAYDGQSLTLDTAEGPRILPWTGPASKTP